MPLTAPQITALALLIEGQMTYEAIAAHVGVHSDTLAKWRKAPEFLAAWTKEQNALSKARLQRLQSEGIDPAITALVDIVKDPTVGASDRVRAAREIIVLSGHKPADRASVEHSGSVEHQMSEEDARATIAQAMRAGLSLVPDPKEDEVKTGT